MDAESDWKTKYFDSLEKLERREAFWVDVETTLKRFISRLSFVGGGRDDKLDDRLEKLRNRVRGEKDLDRLDDMIEGINRRLEAFKLESGNRVDLELMTKALVSLIQEASFPADLQSRARKLRRSLKKEGLNKETLATTENLLLEALGGVSGGEKPGVGLIGRFFNRDTETPQASTASGDLRESETEQAAVALLHRILDRISDTETGSGSVAGLREKLDHADGRADLEDLTEELLPLLNPGPSAKMLPNRESILIQLLEKMDLPTEIRPKMTALRERLLVGLGENELPTVLDELVELVGGARRQAEEERDEVERFLLQLTNRLGQLGQVLAGIQNQGGEILQEQRALGETVTGEVTDLHASVASASDLEDLKQSISRRLAQIQERLKEQRELEHRREQALEDSVSRLKERIGEMERESDKLQQQVNEARSEAFRDALTGLHNRIAYDNRMEEEIARWKRYGNDLSLILLDVDHFKRVNDNYGHKAGDRVLEVIGTLVRQIIRESDYAARYGGEEFVILLPETDLEGAYALAEKLRLAIENKHFQYTNQRVSITASCGLAQFHEPDSADSLFERADKALYQAKESGRNCCLKEEEHTSGP